MIRASRCCAGASRVADRAPDARNLTACAHPRRFCKQKPDLLNWQNGLDLDLRCEAEKGVDTNTGPAARAAWAALQKKMMSNGGPLTPIEEALISPVQAVVSVLKLPSGGQLGYHGNAINFTLDMATVRSRARREAGVAQRE